MRFFINPAYDITKYSGHLQQPKRNRFQDRFWVPVFLVNNIFSKTFHVFHFTKYKKKQFKKLALKLEKIGKVVRQNLNFQRKNRQLPVHFNFQNGESKILLSSII